MTARVRRLASLLGLVSFLAASATLVPARADAGLARWTGSIDLYRPGVFSTQKTFLWCTAADVQIARNIVTGERDHSRASQARYFTWMRARNRYPIPVRDGVDPAGWTAGMRAFVDDRYRLVASDGFDPALHAAVTSLRRTDRPVGLLVANGAHAWLLTGFSATADPAASSRFTVTDVRVVGPLYGLQSRNGYDMPPDTRLTPAQLRRFFTPWHYAAIRMVWEGRWLAIQARPEGEAPAAGTSRPSAAPSVRPSPVSTATGTPTPSTAAFTATGPSGPPATAQLPTPLAPAPPPAFVAAALAVVAMALALGVLIARMRAVRRRADPWPRSTPSIRFGRRRPARRQPAAARADARHGGAP